MRPSSTARRRLQQPGVARHLEDVARHGEGAGRVDEETRRLFVAQVVRHRNRLPRRDDDVFLPVAAAAIEHRDALALDAPRQQAGPVLDDADALEAGHAGQGRLPAVFARGPSAGRRD